MPARHSLPPGIEEFRDRNWWREETRPIETALDAERFVERAGFASCLIDSRKPGPSLYIAVCGRRDAVMPRNVQKDPEASHTWLLKDDVVRRAKVYYGKLARGKTMFVAPRMIPYFKAIWGRDPKHLSRDAQAVFRVLRREWEMATSDLRKATGFAERGRLTKAIDELQAAMLVVPSEVVYTPFTYIWTLSAGRFPGELRKRVSREAALREIARCFLDGAGMTTPGELARVTGLSRPDAGLGNRALVEEGYARRIAPGTYVLNSLTPQ